MKVAELSNFPLQVRKKFWIDELKLPLEWKDFSPEQMENPSVLLQPSEFDGILLDREFSDLVLPHSTRIPNAVIEAGLADSLVRENGKNWLRCFLREALKLLILQSAPRLDTHATCYLTGSDSLARACAAIAIQLGYGDFVVVSSDLQQAQHFVEDLKKLFFGLNVRILGETELTLQPNNGSLLLNTMTVESGAVILEDLTYLNFLKKDGLVVDVPLAFKTNSLIEEAAHVGVRFLSGIEIWGYRDFLFLAELLKGSMPLTLEKYLSQWKSFAAKENQT